LYFYCFKASDLYFQITRLELSKLLSFFSWFSDCDYSSESWDYSRLVIPLGITFADFFEKFLGLKFLEMCFLLRFFWM